MRSTISVLFLLPNIIFAGNWQTLAKKDGITVAKQRVEGSSLLRFRGTGVIRTDIVTLLFNIQDVKNHYKWMGKMYGQKMIERPSDYEAIYYAAMKAPWPIFDRDYVIHVRLKPNLEKQFLVLVAKETKHSKYPVYSNKVRMPLARFSWYLKPLKQDGGLYTWVNMTFRIDPGGLLPNWAINFVTKKFAYLMIKRLRREVKKNKPDDNFTQKYQKYNLWHSN